MDTIKIRHLEFLKTELQFEKKDALHIKCYSRARNLHMQIRKVERDIKFEQIKLWNYVLNESISVANFQLFEDIYRYFDQLNYQIRKIELEDKNVQEEILGLTCFKTTNQSNMIKLYLDDLRPTPNGYLRVYSYKEFVKYILNNGIPDFISFDHDLGIEETGYDCAKFLVEYCLDHNLSIPNFTIHSQNPVGKENIEKLLHNFRKLNK